VGKKIKILKKLITYCHSLKMEAFYTHNPQETEMSLFLLKPRAQQYNSQNSSSKNLKFSSYVTANILCLIATKRLNTFREEISVYGANGRKH